MISIDGSAHATLLAALRFYQQKGQGDPGNRSDEIHDLATNGEQEISLDEEGIDGLCQALNFGCWEPRAAPATEAEWEALARERGWSEAVLSHVIGAGDAVFDGESVIELPGDISLHMPAHPLPCEYLRVVDRSVGKGVELMYWSSDEWRDQPEEVIGAVMGLLKGFQPTLAVALEKLRVPPLAYERTASIDEMARYIATVAEGEPVVDPDAARAAVKERFPMETWRYEVDNGSTELGYWEWALHAAEDEQEELQHTHTPRGG